MNPLHIEEILRDLTDMLINSDEYKEGKRKLIEASSKNVNDVIIDAALMDMMGDLSESGGYIYMAGMGIPDDAIFEMAKIISKTSIAIIKKVDKAMTTQQN